MKYTTSAAMERSPRVYRKPTTRKPYKTQHKPPLDEASVRRRLEKYEERIPNRRDQIEKEERLIAALAMRSYHLPDHTYCDDWLQYLQNNHPIIGICCHYRKHPIKTGLRLLFLMGSILFGLTATNAVWLLFYYYGRDYDAPAISITLNGFGNTAADTAGNSTLTDQQYPPLSSQQQQEEDFQVTQGMLVLWTFGGALHALFDNTVWYFSACICCLSRQNLFTKFQRCAVYCLIVLILTLSGVATLAVLLRTSLEEDMFSESDGTEEMASSSATSAAAHVGNEVRKIRLFQAEKYEYLLSYVAEFVLALFVYYPLIGTFFFSGVLGCGKIPLLGGRPYEVQVEARQQSRRVDNQVL